MSSAGCTSPLVLHEAAGDVNLHNHCQLTATVELCGPRCAVHWRKTTVCQRISSGAQLARLACWAAVSTVLLRVCTKGTRARSVTTWDARSACRATIRGLEFFLSTAVAFFKRHFLPRIEELLLGSLIW